MTRRPRLRRGALRRRPRLAAGIGVWLTAAVVLNEVFDPPFDPVRLVFKLVLAGLMTWFLVSLLSHFSESED